MNNFNEVRVSRIIYWLHKYDCIVMLKRRVATVTKRTTQCWFRAKCKHNVIRCNTHQEVHRPAQLDGTSMTLDIISTQRMQFIFTCQLSFIPLLAEKWPHKIKLHGENSMYWKPTSMITKWYLKMTSSDNQQQL